MFYNLISETWFVNFLHFLLSQMLRYIIIVIVIIVVFDTRWKLLDRLLIINLVTPGTIDSLIWRLLLLYVGLSYSYWMYQCFIAVPCGNSGRQRVNKQRSFTDASQNLISNRIINIRNNLLNRSVCNVFLKEVNCVWLSGRVDLCDYFLTTSLLC